MELSAGGDVVDAAFPGKSFGDEIGGSAFGVDGGKLADEEFVGDFGGVGEDNGALDGVLQFADIAGP
jgi:hypothetical protein